MDKAAAIKNAQKFLAKGQIDKAIAEWEGVAANYPEGNTFNYLGDLYLKKANKEKAMETYHKAARVYMDEGFQLKALALYKKILNVNRSDAGALIALGELSEGKSITTDAIKYGETVAISVSSGQGKWYLQSRSAATGISLGWSNEPVYEWKIVGGSLSDPVHLFQPLGLYNTRVDDEMVFCYRDDGGENLKWRRNCSGKGEGRNGAGNARPPSRPTRCENPGVDEEPPIVRLEYMGCRDGRNMYAAIVGNSGNSEPATSFIKEYRIGSGSWSALTAMHIAAGSNERVYLRARACYGSSCSPFAYDSQRGQDCSNGGVVHPF